MSDFVMQTKTFLRRQKKFAPNHQPLIKTRFFVQWIRLSFIVLKWGGVGLVPKYFWHLRKVFACIKNSLIFWILSRRHLKDLIRRFLKQVLLFDVCVEVLSDTFNLIHATLFSLGIGNQNKQSQWHFFSPIGKFVKIFPPLNWNKWKITKMQFTFFSAGQPECTESPFLLAYIQR